MKNVNRKITVHIPQDLLKKAQGETGLGITETIRKGLQLVASRSAYENLRKLRGKEKIAIDIKKLREDRE